MHVYNIFFTSVPYSKSNWRLESTILSHVVPNFPLIVKQNKRPKLFSAFLLSGVWVFIKHWPKIWKFFKNYFKKRNEKKKELPKQLKAETWKFNKTALGHKSWGGLNSIDVYKVFERTGISTEFRMWISSILETEISKIFIAPAFKLSCGSNDCFCKFMKIKNNKYQNNYFAWKAWFDQEAAPFMVIYCVMRRHLFWHLSFIYWALWIRAKPSTELVSIYFGIKSEISQSLMKEQFLPYSLVVSKNYGRTVDCEEFAHWTDSLKN